MQLMLMPEQLIGDVVGDGEATSTMSSAVCCEERAITLTDARRLGRGRRRRLRPLNLLWVRDERHVRLFARAQKVLLLQCRSRQQRLHVPGPRPARALSAAS